MKHSTEKYIHARSSLDFKRTNSYIARNVTTEATLQSHSETMDVVLDKTFYVFIGVAVLTLAFLVWILYVAKMSRCHRSQPRSGSTLMSHMFALAVLSSIMNLVYIAVKLKWIRVEGKWSCGVLQFSKEILRVIYPLNVIGIVQEHTVVIHGTSRRMLVNQKLYIMWLLAMGVSSPSLVAYADFIHQDSQRGLKNCKNTLPIAFQAGYQMFRFIIFYIFPSLYILGTVASEFWPKLVFLRDGESISSGSNRHRIKCVQFAIFYSIIFNLSWISYGLFDCILRQLILPMPHWLHRATTLLGFLNYVIIIFNPLIHLCMNSGSSVKEILPCYCVSLDNGENARIDLVEGSEMSRFPTVGRSDTWNIGEIGE